MSVGRRAGIGKLYLEGLIALILSLLLFGLWNVAIKPIVTELNKVLALFSIIPPAWYDFLSFIAILVVIVPVMALIVRSRLRKLIFWLTTRRIMTRLRENYGKGIAPVKISFAGASFFGVLTQTTHETTENGMLEECVVFVPSSPTPVTGWTTLLDPSKVRRVDLKPTAIIAFLVSGGLQPLPPYRSWPITDPDPRIQGTCGAES